MIARRIVTILLFVLFILILELNKNSVWGFILTAVLTVAFFVLFESGILREKTPLKVVSWLAFFAVFAGILFLTWPPVKRVPAVTYKDPVETEVLTLKDGKVSGVVTEDGKVEIFAGIPYAAPPVGDLRWREPQDAVPWEGVLKADTFAPMAMQPTNLPIYDSLAQIIGYHDYKWFDFSDNYTAAVDEDALYVNVWRPAGGGSGLPVLVFIHGGSLQTGQPWYADYSGRSLAADGVIVVNMGYRLGVFGYLALDGLASESAVGTTGNYGLLDQIKALEWVRDNISAFGGDPDNVTLAGESAGAASVSAICASPLAKGLFRRAVLESSTVVSKEPPHSFRSFDEALESGTAVLEKYGVSTAEELRALPANKLVSSAETEHHITVDGYALEEMPYKVYEAGDQNEEAILHGFNAKESGPFIIFSGASMKNYEDKIRSYFKEYTDEIISLYPASNDDEAAEMWAEIYGAVFFDYPHYCLERLENSTGIPTYQYYFSKDNGRLGCWHSGEMIYLYGNIPDDSSLYDDADRALSAEMKEYFINFIRTGDPNGEGLPEWKSDVDPASYMEFGDNTGEIREKDRKIGLFSILDRMNENQ
ncbi:MAG: carboxylesterase family protein [Clostridia bacterium]|nr:carboxylesterase family protein [Clostridia bacterium]